MIPARASRSAPLLLAAAFLCAGLAHAQAALGPEAVSQLRAAIATGRADLRWPDFSDYREHLEKFYGFRPNGLWWVQAGEPTPQARRVIAVLQQAAQKGLLPEDYDASGWSGRLSRLKPAVRQPAQADEVNFDLALTVSIMRYISDLHIGKVNPKHFDFAFDEEPKKYDLPEFLRDRVVAAGDVDNGLAQVEPHYPGYRRLLQALQSYIQLAQKDAAASLPPPDPPKKAVAPGDTYPGVARLASLLRLVGDLPPDAAVPADSPVYQGALVEAVKSFQRRHGRDATGRIDAQTLASLNVPLSRRLEQMRWALERWRWLPDYYRTAPVVANIPEFRLRAYDKDFNVGVTMKVVVGRSYGHHTPVFAETMKYVVFRPYWEVTPSIIKGEMIPAIKKDPGYLAAKDLEVVDARQNVVATGAVSPEVLQQLSAGKLFIRQRPGPKNSLGLVKFLFPNAYNVYMHDTPATELFAQSRRDFSHGCIRLERPADLAAWVLRDNPGWTPERIHAAMNGNAPVQVNLAHPIPVVIVYATAVVLEDGLVRFYDDIYGHDAALEKVLAKGYPYPW